MFVGSSLVLQRVAANSVGTLPGSVDQVWRPHGGDSASQFQTHDIRMSAVGLAILDHSTESIYMWYIKTYMYISYAHMHL